ncbi:MAG TPA: S1/P1 nuclease [Xanthomonadales bacterium]|nr:S1/P1 nuclease [Xanthomonadales bacterium]
MVSMWRGACLILVLVLAAPASAWGPRGHAIVAELASRELSPGARAEVERLLGGEARRSLLDVATWPDFLRKWPGYGNTPPLHYVNFPRGECHYVAARDCPGGRCVVEAIEHFRAVLASDAPDAERADALKWVAHLVADVHQPLHATWGDDRGGNSVQLRFRGEGTNLHALLDSGLLATRELSARRYADAIAQEGTPATTVDRAGLAAGWAEESCALGREAYPAARGVDDAYVARWRPVLEQRLSLAATRLAALLDATLARTDAGRRVDSRAPAEGRRKQERP